MTREEINMEKHKHVFGNCRKMGSGELKIKIKIRKVNKQNLRIHGGNFKYQSYINIE